MSNRKIFTQEDQEAFARLSGDYNPLHIDPLVARRLLFGNSVVHGIHAVLWSLDTALENQLELVEIQALDVTFPKPIPVDEEVALTLLIEGTHQISATIQRGPSVVTTLAAQLATSPGNLHIKVDSEAPEASQARDLSDSDYSGLAEELALRLPPVEAQAMFPNLTRCMRPDHFRDVVGDNASRSLKLERGW